MEIRLRPVLFGLALLATCALGTYLSRDAWTPVLGRLMREPGQTTTPVLPGDAAKPTAFRFLDGSERWDWKANGCGELLESFLARYSIRSAQLVLVDDASGLVISTVYPDLTSPAARARVLCKGENGDLTCRLAVQEGQPGDALDVAVTTAVAWGIEDFFRPRTDAAWEAAQKAEWSWGHFRPLIAEGGSGWRSACLSVSQQ